MSDRMTFPATPFEFIADYSFKDKEEVYTNGAELIPVFRVEQMIEEYFTIHTDEAEADVRHFDTGAVRDDATGKGRFDLLPWAAIHALAKHCERGALHYGERNVDKGIPQHSLIDSGIRHLALYIQGDAEAHHLVAALWNIAWAVEQEVKRKHLVDLPEREGVEVEAV